MTKLNKRSFVSAVAVSLVALLLCTAFTFSWLTSKIDYLNTVIRMGDFGATVNVFYEDGSLLTTGSTAGDDVVVNNSIDDNQNWSAGTVGYRFVEVKNTGTINLNTYLTFDFMFSNFLADNKTVADSFYVNVVDISSAVKDYSANGNKLQSYIKNYVADSATGIQKIGHKFSDATDVQKLGMTVGGGVSYYLLEYCCYDLSSLVFNADSALAMGAKIRVQQTNAPVVQDDKGVVLGNGKKQVTSVGDSAKISEDKNVQSTTVAQNTQKTTVPATKPASTSKPATQPTTVATTVPTTTIPAITTTVPVNEWDIVYLDENKQTCQVAAYRGDKKELKLPTTLNGAMVTGISGYAFVGAKVQKLIVPATVSSIDFAAFDTDSIKEVEFNKTTEVDGVEFTSPFCSEDNVIYTADKSVLLKYMTQKDEESFKISSKTAMISDNAFSNVKSLKKLDMCNVQSVSSTAFDGAAIKDYVFHTATPPMTSAMESFGKVTFSIDKNGEAQYKTDAKLHVPGSAYASYKKSVGFANYEKAGAIEKDSKLGSSNVGTEKKDGITYTIIKNNSEYSDVEYSSKDADYVAVVTDYDKIPSNGVVKIPSSVKFEETTEDEDGEEEVKSYKCPVVGIADNAFKDATKLKMVVLPNRDVYYTSKAFTGCDNLGLIDYDSVLPFDVSKFDVLLDNIKISDKEDKED